MRTTTWLETSNPFNLCGFLGFPFLEILFRDFLNKISTSKKSGLGWLWPQIYWIIHFWRYGHWIPPPWICRGITVFYDGSSTKTPRILDWHGYSHPTTSHKIERVNTSETKPAKYQESFRRAISLWIDHLIAKSSPRMVDSFTLSWPFIQMLIWRYPWKYIPQIILAFLKSHGSIKRIFHHLLWGTYLFKQRLKSHAKSCSGVTSHNICVSAFGNIWHYSCTRYSKDDTHKLVRSQHGNVLADLSSYQTDMSEDHPAAMPRSPGIPPLPLRPLGRCVQPTALGAIWTWRTSNCAGWRGHRSILPTSIPRFH